MLTSPAADIVGQVDELVAGAAPIPPPYTAQFCPNADELAITLELEKYGMPPEFALVGYAMVAQVGAALEPDSRGRLAVAVPARTANAEAPE